MYSGQLSFFEPLSSLPEGLAYRAEFVSPDEEAELLEHFRKLDFREYEFHGYLGKRRVVSFGLHYEANEGTVRSPQDIPAFLQMLGYASTPDLAGKHMGGIYTDTHQWFELADYLRSETPFNGLIAEWKRKDESPTVVRISGRSVSIGDEGTVFELFVEDVTERRALEQQLRQCLTVAA